MTLEEFDAALAALGWKPIVLLSSETLFIAFYMLAIVFLTRLLSA